MKLIFRSDYSGTMRASGYATVPCSSNAEDETIIETTEAELSGAFKAAISDGLPDTGIPTESVIDQIDNK